MTGFWVSFRTTDGKICEIEFFLADFHKEWYRKITQLVSNHQLQRI